MLNLKYYTKVEYIRGTGNQAIDTKVVPTNKTDFELTCKFDYDHCTKPNQSDSGVGFIGCTDTITKRTLAVNFGGNNQKQFYLWKHEAYQLVPNVTIHTMNLNNQINPLTKFRLSCIDNKWYYNDIYKSESIPKSQDDWVMTDINTIFLFAINRTGGWQTRLFADPMNVYGLKIWNDGELLRDFIPVIRNRDNKPGLYDLVNDVFYINLGTGEFEIGPIIEKYNGDEISNEIDWTQSMEQSFEYYEVDPNTWKDIKLIQNVKSASINRDIETETLGSATIDVDNLLGECYIRIYLIAIQNEIREKIPLGTYLVQTPNSSFDGKVRSVSMDAYTPLLELKENKPPLGYALLKDENIMRSAYAIVRERCRAPVVETESDKQLIDDFVANVDESWIEYISNLIANAKFSFNLDELGRILFSPIQKIDELQPVYTFNDDNSSILYPEMNLKHDLYGIPNVVEVSCVVDNEIYTAIVKNEDVNSPTSIQRRGRTITHRETNPSIPGYPTTTQVDEYAEALLKTLSSVEYEITYSHGYCPVRIGDCVRLNYASAGITGVKAKVISQSIKCESGCTVNERAIFTKNLWK